MSCFRSDLPAKPTVKSLQDLDALLLEIAIIRHHSDELSAACSRQIDQAKAECQKQMVCMVGRSSVDVATREKQLYEVAETWCRKHLKKHLPGDERSVALSHGKAGLRQQAPKVLFVEGVTEKIAIERIEQKTGIIAAVAALITKAFANFTIGDVLRFRPEINKQEIKALWDSKPEARATLGELGITVQAGDDQVVLEPTKYRVERTAE